MQASMIERLAAGLSDANVQINKSGAAGVPVLTFVSRRSGYFYECQNQRDTSKYMILVWL